jgi:transposase
MSFTVTLERAMKRQEVILKAISGELSWIRAADILGVSPRQMRRIKNAYQIRGFSYVVDQRYGRPSWNRAPVAEVKEVLSLYRDKYFDFSVQHFHDKLVEEHQSKRSYSWLKKILQEANLVSKERKRKKHRRKRERKPLVGMMLHLDGSTHYWLGDDQPKWDLVLILDDANGEVYDAIFVEEEDTRSVMTVIQSVVEKCGIFCSLYTDRASHFVYTRKAGESRDKTVKTQCERALEQLGIELIVAYSPQARGRGERFWRTIQGRLPQELRLAGISTLEQANQYLKEVFVPDLNKRFVVEPKEKGSAFFPVSSDTDLNRIFSLQHERQVRNDNTVSFKTLTLQIPKSSIRHHFVRCNVKIYEHLNGAISIGFGPHTIARFHNDGTGFKTSDQNNTHGLCGRNPTGYQGQPMGSAHQAPASLTLPTTVLGTAALLARANPQGGTNAELC